jgi:signal peptidase I
MLSERVLRSLSLILRLSIIAGLSFLIGMSYGAEQRDCRPEWLLKTMDMTNNIPDRISIGQIHQFPGKVVIEGDYQISEFADSNSMLPTLDSGSNGIQIPVYPNTTLKRGDIISFKLEEKDYTIAHRITDIREDSKGIYYITKGDYQELPDPYRVRHDQVQRLMVGVIW